jgi:hypothetical protein
MPSIKARCAASRIGGMLVRKPDRLRQTSWGMGWSEPEIKEHRPTRCSLQRKAPCGTVNPVIKTHPSLGTLLPKTTRDIPKGVHDQHSLEPTSLKRIAEKRA